MQINSHKREEGTTSLANTYKNDTPGQRKMPLTKNMSSGKVIKDIVHSKNKMFAHDSKKQRIRRALGAYYSMHKEEQVNEISRTHAAAYLKKANTELANKSNTISRKIKNRRIGVIRAYDKAFGAKKKIVNELSDRKLHSYVKNAKSELDLGFGGYKKRQNRANGLIQAKKRLRHEETVNELYGKGKTETIAAHHLTKVMAKGAEGKPETEVHRAKFQRAIGLGVKQIYAKRDKLRKAYEETKVNELHGKGDLVKIGAHHLLRSQSPINTSWSKKAHQKSFKRAVSLYANNDLKKTIKKIKQNEGVEALREISNELRKRYVGKAAGDVRDTAYMAGMRDAANPNHARYWNKAEKRTAGIRQAMKTMK